MDDCSPLEKLRCAHTSREAALDTLVRRYSIGRLDAWTPVARQDAFIARHRLFHVKRRPASTSPPGSTCNDHAIRARRPLWVTSMAGQDPATRATHRPFRSEPIGLVFHVKHDAHGG